MVAHLVAILRGSGHVADAEMRGDSWMGSARDGRMKVAVEG